MSALAATPRPFAARRPFGMRRIAIARAVLALAWAAALVLSVRHHAPTTHSDLGSAAAVVLTTYPLIDVVASVLAASASVPSSARLLRVNAVISSAAVVALGVTTFGSDVRNVLIAFGAWAAVSGVLQLAVAIGRHRTTGWQVPTLVSGGLSTLAGLSFIASSRHETAHLANLGGYMAFGAVLFLLSARRPSTSIAG